MAASEETCEENPDFAVICSFITKFGDDCGVNISIPYLKQLLEDTKIVSDDLSELLIHLLRRGRKRVTKERWEKSLIKFCHEYSSVDAWELERFGYKNSKLSVKLELLKRLLELQFDSNAKFKCEVNKQDAQSLRIPPIGRDINGHVYWYQLDKDYNMRLYRQSSSESNEWQLLCSTTDELKSLLESLEKGTNIKTETKEESKESSENTDTVQKIDTDGDDLKACISQTKPCTIIIKTERKETLLSMLGSDGIKLINDSDSNATLANEENPILKQVPNEADLKIEDNQNEANVKVKLESAACEEAKKALPMEVDECVVEKSDLAQSKDVSVSDAEMTNVEIEKHENEQRTEDSTKSKKLSEEKVSSNAVSSICSSLPKSSHQKSSLSDPIILQKPENEKEILQTKQFAPSITSTNESIFKGGKFKQYERWNNEKKQAAAHSVKPDSLIAHDLSSSKRKSDMPLLFAEDLSRDSKKSSQLPSLLSSKPPKSSSKCEDSSRDEAPMDLSVSHRNSSTINKSSAESSPCDFRTDYTKISNLSKSNAECNGGKDKPAHLVSPVVCKQFDNFKSIPDISRPMKKKHVSMSKEEILNQNSELSRKSVIFEVKNSKLNQYQENQTSSDSIIPNKTVKESSFSHLQALQNMCDTNMMINVQNSVIHPLNSDKRLNSNSISNKTCLNSSEKSYNDTCCDNLSKLYNFSSVQASDDLKSSLESNVPSMPLKSNISSNNKHHSDSVMKDSKSDNSISSTKSCVKSNDNVHCKEILPIHQHVDPLIPKSTDISSNVVDKTCNNSNQNSSDGHHDHKNFEKLEKCSDVDRPEPIKNKSFLEEHSKIISKESFNQEDNIKNSSPISVETSSKSEEGIMKDNKILESVAEKETTKNIDKTEKSEKPSVKLDSNNKDDFAHGNSNEKISQSLVNEESPASNADKTQKLLDDNALKLPFKESSKFSDEKVSKSFDDFSKSNLVSCEPSENQAHKSSCNLPTKSLHCNLPKSDEKTIESLKIISLKTSEDKALKSAEKETTKLSKQKSDKSMDDTKKTFDKISKSPKNKIPIVSDEEVVESPIDKDKNSGEKFSEDKNLTKDDKSLETLKDIAVKISDQKESLTDQFDKESSVFTNDKDLIKVSNIKESLKIPDEKVLQSDDDNKNSDVITRKTEENILANICNQKEKSSINELKVQNNNLENQSIISKEMSSVKKAAQPNKEIEKVDEESNVKSAEIVYDESQKKTENVEFSHSSEKEVTKQISSQAESLMASGGNSDYQNLNSESQTAQNVDNSLSNESNSVSTANEFPERVNENCSSMKSKDFIEKSGVKKDKRKIKNLEKPESQSSTETLNPKEAHKSKNDCNEKKISSEKEIPKLNNLESDKSKVNIVSQEEEDSSTSKTESKIITTVEKTTCQVIGSQSESDHFESNKKGNSSSKDENCLKISSESAFKDSDLNKQLENHKKIKDNNEQVCVSEVTKQAVTFDNKMEKPASEEMEMVEEVNCKATESDCLEKEKSLSKCTEDSTSIKTSENFLDTSAVKEHSAIGSMEENCSVSTVENSVKENLEKTSSVENEEQDDSSLKNNSCKSVQSSTKERTFESSESKSSTKESKDDMDSGELDEQSQNNSSDKLSKKDIHENKIPDNPPSTPTNDKELQNSKEINSEAASSKPKVAKTPRTRRRLFTPRRNRRKSNAKNSTNDSAKEKKADKIVLKSETVQSDDDSSESELNLLALIKRKTEKKSSPVKDDSKHITCDEVDTKSKIGKEPGHSFDIRSITHSICLETKIKRVTFDKCSSTTSLSKTRQSTKQNLITSLSFDTSDDIQIIEEKINVSPLKKKKGRLRAAPPKPLPPRVEELKKSQPARSSPKSASKKRGRKDTEKLLAETEEDQFSIPEGFLEILSNTTQTDSQASKAKPAKVTRVRRKKEELVTTSQHSSESESTPIKRSRRIQEQHQKKMSELAVEMEREQRMLEQLAKKTSAKKVTPQKASTKASDVKSPRVGKAKLKPPIAEEETCMETKRTTRKMNSRSRNITKMTLMYEDESKDSEFSTSRETEKSKKRRRGRGHKKGTGHRPWDVSSESSSTLEELTEEEEEEEPDEPLVFEVNEDEFACEEIDENDEPVIVRRARTAKKAPEDITAEETVVNDDKPCIKCGKYDRPEWILLCDKCDNGYHTTCLIPPLLIIPDGDWYCQPCEHLFLCECLQKELQKLEVVLKQREREELRKQRLAYVGISLDNVLKPEKKEKSDVSSKEEEEEEEVIETKSRRNKESSDDERHKKLFGKRSVRARRNVNYQFKEYDELIASAIQEEMLGVGVPLDEEFDDCAKHDDDDDSEKSFKAAVRPKRKKRTRKLNDLDFTDEDDSGEEYKGLSTDSEHTPPPSSNESEPESAASGEWRIVKTKGKPKRKARRGRRGRDSSDEEWDEGNNSDAYRPVTRRAAQKAISYRELSSDEDEEWNAAPKAKVPKKRKKASSSEDSELSFKKKPVKRKSRVRKWASSESSESENVSFKGSDTSQEESEDQWKIKENYEGNRIKININKKVLSSDGESSSQQSMPKKKSNKIESEEESEEGEEDEEEDEEEEEEGGSSSEEVDEEESDEESSNSKPAETKKLLPSKESSKIELPKAPEPQKTVIKALNSAENSTDSVKDKANPVNATVRDKPPMRTVKKDATKMVPCVIPYVKSPKSGHATTPDEESDKEIPKEKILPRLPFPKTVKPIQATQLPPSTPQTSNQQRNQPEPERRSFASTIMEPFSNMDEESEDSVPLERIPTSVPPSIPNKPRGFEQEYTPAKELSSFSYTTPEEKSFPPSYSSLAPFADFSSRPSPLKPSLVETYSNNSSPSKLTPLDNPAKLTPLDNPSKLMPLENPSRLMPLESTSKLMPLEHSSKLLPLDNPSKFTPLDSYSRSNSPRGFVSLDSYSEARKKKHFFGNTSMETEGMPRPVHPSDNYQGEIRFPPEPYPCPQSPNTYSQRSSPHVQRDPGTPPRLYSQFPDAYGPPRSPDYYQNHQYYGSEERIPRPPYQTNYVPPEQGPPYVPNPYVATPVPQPNGGFMIDTLLQARNPEEMGDELTGVTDIVSYITQEK